MGSEEIMMCWYHRLVHQKPIQIDNLIGWQWPPMCVARIEVTTGDLGGIAGMHKMSSSCLLSPSNGGRHTDTTTQSVHSMRRRQADHGHTSLKEVLGYQT